jgi:hypothetical protein
VTTVGKFSEDGFSLEEALRSDALFEYRWYTEGGMKTYLYTQ